MDGRKEAVKNAIRATSGCSFHALRLHDVTNELNEHRIIQICEIVWSVPYWNDERPFDALIYTSLDRKTKVARTKGTDRVRLVLRRLESAEGGLRYFSVAEHNRNATVPENIAKDLLEATRSIRRGDFAPYKPLNQAGFYNF